MISLRDINYVRLGTRDLDAATRFACQVVELELTRTEGRSRYFRSDQREHTLVYFDGDPDDHTVGFELESTSAVDRAGGELSNAGLEVRAGSALACEQRGVRAFINFRDHSGNSIDLVAGTNESARLSRRRSRRGLPASATSDFAQPMLVATSGYGRMCLARGSATASV